MLLARMPAAPVAAICLALFHGCSAAPVTTKLASAEARSMKQVMEAARLRGHALDGQLVTPLARPLSTRVAGPGPAEVRVELEHHHHTATAVPAVESQFPGAQASIAPMSVRIMDGEYLVGEHSFDDELLNKANKVEMEISAMKSVPKAFVTPRRMAAVTQTQESEHTRAARYFATHGMAKVGHMLGDEVAARGQGHAASAHLAQEEQEAHERRAWMAAHGNDELSDYQKQWNAVDVLRRRAAAFAHHA